MPHKLLLADDSVTIQRVIELTFADEDVQVTVVGDGKQAIEQLQRNRPDIVLADIGMPERDGYEVAAFIKSNPQLAHIPVILLTGAFEPIDQDRARTVRSDGVLVKPFEPQTVINRVRELLAAPRGAAPTPPLPQPAVPAPQPQPADVLVEIDSDLAPPPADATKKPEAGDSLEDYFDRLDAAFASLEHRPAPSLAPGEEDLSAHLQDLDQPPPQVPGSSEPLTGWDPDLATGLAPARQPHLAGAFAALLAAEQGQEAPDTALLMPPAAVSEDTIEEIVRRVLARMSDESMRSLVIDTAERVVREEIDRIKRMTGSSER
ncbi:MAG TPA: response regulator [Tepidiformaceae bacterium]|jgi:CheY-like chemotaxis protein|nr:response regulator [Tepidiformaceae bacterium]